MGLLSALPNTEVVTGAGGLIPQKLASSNEGWELGGKTTLASQHLVGTTLEVCSTLPLELPSGIEI